MNSRNFVLLAAGRGSRLSELTRHTHKALLPIAGKPVIQHILDQLMLVKEVDVVVVTGYRCDEINSFLRSAYGSAVRTVFNKLYEDDTNILSADIGVDALLRPDTGYTVVETDIVLEPDGWQQLLMLRQTAISEWVTCGNYSERLTGAALKIDETGRVLRIVYAPSYDDKYHNWAKLLGILKVGEKEVVMDRKLRKEAINRSIGQYYLVPWMENLAQLPCKSLDLSNYYAISFNDLNTYRKIAEDYGVVIQKSGGLLYGQSKNRND